MASQKKDAEGAVSKRMKLVIVVILLFILLPATVMSLPLSTIEVTVTNLDSDKGLSVHITVHDAEDGYFSAYLLPGEQETFSCTVNAGTHQITGQYWPDGGGYYYGSSLSASCSVWPFETESVSFGIMAW